MIRRSLVFASSCGVLLLASGCAFMPEGGERAEFLEPPSMKRTFAEAVREKRAAAPVDGWPADGWWRMFNCSDLTDIMTVVLNENHELKKSLARLNEAESVARVEGARLLPFIDADMSMVQLRVPNHGLVAAYNPELAGREVSMAFVNPFAFRYEFDFWGKNRAIFDAALGEAAAEEAEHAETRLVLTTTVARLYFRGVALSQQVALASEMAEMKRKLLHLAETRFRTGFDTQDAVKEATVELETAEKREAATRELLRVQQHLLARLMGDGPDATQSAFAGKYAVIPKTIPLPKRLPVELLAHRPDLVAAMRHAEAAAEHIHAAKAEFLPSFDLSATAGLQSVVTSTHIGKLGSFLFRSSAFNYEAVPGVRLPIFEGGQLRGKLEARRAGYDEAVELYNETLLNAARQVADSLTNWKEARKILDAQKRLLASKQAELNLALVRWRSGMKDQREILASQHAVLENQFALKTHEADLLSAIVDLIQALGGGYSNGGVSPRPELSPEEPISPLENFTPTWNLEAAAPALRSLFWNGATE